MSPSIEQVRSQFPALSSGFAFLENAGGSQVPLCVAEAVKEHMLSDYVQLGAGYGQSIRANQLVKDAHRFGAEFFNSGSTGQIFLGPSTTALIHMVAKASGEIWKPNDEIVIAETNHEANAGAWDRLRDLGLTVKTWKFDRESLTCKLDTLKGLLTERTKLVAMPHVSNLVGSLEEVKGACKLAHEVGAQVFADGVAYAPHRLPDVQELEVDWYVCSVYKVYGPHLAILYGRSEALQPLVGPNHSFISSLAYPDKWEPGGISHEACAGMLALERYFGLFSDGNYRGRSTLAEAYGTMSEFERPVEHVLRNWVHSHPNLRLLGNSDASDQSVATVSFVHKRLPSDEITRVVDQAQIGIRHGNMYAVRLLDGLGIVRYPGVVRVSAVHYNTVEEVDRLIAVLDPLFAS